MKKNKEPRMSPAYFSILASLALTACTSDALEADRTRDQAADGKADGNNDICEAQRWYGDGYCDTPYCRNPDPDCAGAIVLSFEHDGTEVIIGKGTDAIVQLSATVGAWEVTSVDRTLGQPQTMRVEPGFFQFRWKTAGLFETVGLHPVEISLLDSRGAVISDYRFTLDIREIR
jgi:hypothetical protein